MSQDTDFLQRLLKMFFVEAEERIQKMMGELIDLDESSGKQAPSALVESLYREAHSLKGSARAVSQTKIERISEGMERTLSALKDERIQHSHNLCTLLLDCLRQVQGLCKDENSVSSDQIDTMVEALTAAANDEPFAQIEIAGTPQPATVADNSTATPKTGQPPQLPEPAAVISGKAVVTPKPPASTAPPSRPVNLTPGGRDQPAVAAKTESAEVAAVTASQSSVRIPAQRLEAILRSGEELSSLKQTASHRHQRLLHLKALLQKNRSLWQRIGSAQHEDRLSSGLLIDYQLKGSNVRSEGTALFAQLDSQLTALIRDSRNDVERTAAMLDILLDDVRSVLLRPLATVTDSMRMMVRQLADDQGKSVRIALDGGDFEIDKRILDGLKTPLVHLLRNCVDHGLESPGERFRASKPPQGEIRISAAQLDSSRVELIVQDDGAGIDHKKLLEKAIAKGLISDDEAGQMTPQRALGLIFQSGLSTREQKGELSGHGLGMAIVREELENIGGTISVDSEPGLGTRFTIELPISLSTFQGVLIETCGQRFAVPTLTVDRVLRIGSGDLLKINNDPCLSLDGEMVVVRELSEILQLENSVQRNADQALHAVVLSYRGQRIAFAVDRVLDEQEILVKNLGSQLISIPNISGATTLGDGSIVPILNTRDLLNTARSGSRRELFNETRSDDHKAQLLVVDDSMTSRTLIRSILQAEGYLVVSAVDGADALNALHSHPVELIVSDVEMPNIDGFELTARVRKDAETADIPVILVTSLASDEHRAKGIEAGADAYIVKGGFDQNELLAAITRLLPRKH